MLTTAALCRCCAWVSPGLLQTVACFSVLMDIKEIKLDYDLESEDLAESVRAGVALASLRGEYALFLCGGSMFHNF